jgi:hypothetical protein
LNLTPLPCARFGDFWQLCFRIRTHPKTKPLIVF